MSKQNTPPRRMGHGPMGPRMGAGAQAKNFKGTMRQLRYLR